MKIELEKFGNILISRQAGREAFAAFHASLSSIPQGENLEIDFTGVITFSPSWGDEFLSPLKKQFGDKLVLANIANNPSVIESLKIIERAIGASFNVA
jgi:hypothetical protein